MYTIKYYYQTELSIMPTTLIDHIIHASPIESVTMSANLFEIRVLLTVQLGYTIVTVMRHSMMIACSCT